MVLDADDTLLTADATDVMLKSGRDLGGVLQKLRVSADIIKVTA